MPQESKKSRGRLSRSEKVALAITGAIAVIVSGVCLAQEPSVALNRSDRAVPAITTRNPTLFRPVATLTQPAIAKRASPPAPVDWKSVRARKASADKSRRAQPSTTARLSRAELNRTRMPVLIPRDGGVIKTEQARMVSMGDAYSLNLPQDKGQDITVYGTRSLVQGERGSVSGKSISRIQTVAEDVQITRMEDGWSATFSRFGVVYAVDFLCTDDQPECQNDTHIRKIVADMDEVALGDQAEAEADAALNPPVSAPTRWINKAVSTVTGTVRDVTGGSLR